MSNFSMLTTVPFYDQYCSGYSIISKCSHWIFLPWSPSHRPCCQLHDPQACLIMEVSLGSPALCGCGVKGKHAVGMESASASSPQISPVYKLVFSISFILLTFPSLYSLQGRPAFLITLPVHSSPPILPTVAFCCLRKVNFASQATICCVSSDFSLMYLNVVEGNI